MARRPTPKKPKFTTHQNTPLAFGLSGGPTIPLPTAYDASLGFAQWGDLDNDGTNDCTTAAAGHMVQTWHVANNNPPAIDGQDTKNDDGIISTVYASVPKDIYGNVLMPDVLSYWLGTPIGTNQIAAYEQLNQGDTDQIKTCIYLYGGCYLGFQLAPYFLRDSKVSSMLAAQWDLPVTGAIGPAALNAPGFKDHCVTAIAYDASTITVVTWGQRKSMTLRFYHEYMLLAYALLSKDWLNGNANISPTHHDGQTLRSYMSNYSSPVYDPDVTFGARTAVT